MLRSALSSAVRRFSTSSAAAGRTSVNRRWMSQLSSNASVSACSRAASTTASPAANSAPFRSAGARVAPAHGTAALPTAQSLSAALAALRSPRVMRRLLSAGLLGQSGPMSPLAMRFFSSSSSSSAPPSTPPTPPSAKDEKDRSLAISIIALIVFVFGVSYLMVPLYRIFCAMTGIQGDVQVKNQTLLDEIEKKRAEGYRPKRRFTIEFSAATAKDLPWSFTPLQKKIEVYPGDTALAFYLAKNETNAPITGVATYNVNPLKGGLYFNKIQCFCFEEQRLQPNEEIEMPVFFFIDPEVENDARFTDVDKIILNYTFFPVEYGETEEQRIEHAKFVASLDLRKSADAAADSAATALPVQAQPEAGAAAQ